MTIYHGISLILLSVLLLIVGLIKPKWILFWMEQPTRLMITGICMIIFMVGTVLFGEGNKQKQLELQRQAAIVKSGKPLTDDTPKPETAPKPVAPAAPPAQAPSTSANDLRP